ncbi:MAG: FtsX-like permease family protein, partial [Maricaulaceae bacterium]
APGASIQAVADRFDDFVERRMPTGQRQSARLSLFAFPINEITTRDLDVTLFAGSDYGLSTVGVLIGFGALTLLIAAINYANLATAQAASHRKDVGMRKALGAGRFQIMTQSWLETLTQTCAALVLALVILVLARPVVMSAWQVDALYFLTRDAAGFAVVGAIVLGVSLLAGAYPALVLSGVQPVRALQSGRSRAGPKFIARILVAVQFVAASFLLIMLTVGVEQRAFFERTALGAREDPIVVLGDIMQVGVSYDAFENALSGAPGVVSMTVDDRPPWTAGATTFFVSRTPEEGAAYLNVLAKHVGHDYFETLGLNLQAGRAFQRDRETEPRTLGTADPSTPMPVMIDRALADGLGFATPEAAVDQVVYLPVRFMRFVGRSVAQPVQILGVVDQDMMRVEARGTSGYIYVFGPNSPANNALYPVIRLDRQNLTAGLASVDRALSELSPNTAISVEFFDELFEQAYSEYARVSQLFILLAGTAFIIASIGQLGIAVHVVSRRRHEIGVRKVLGSTSLGVVRLLLIDFSKPALIANLLAWPLGYLAAQTYLSAFAHRIELTPAPFLISMAITLAIAWAAVIGEVLKAASVRPAEVLRHA